MNEVEIQRDGIWVPSRSYCHLPVPRVWEIDVDQKLILPDGTCKYVGIISRDWIGREFDLLPYAYFPHSGMLYLESPYQPLQHALCFRTEHTQEGEFFVYDEMLTWRTSLPLMRRTKFLKMYERI